MLSPTPEELELDLNIGIPMINYKDRIKTFKTWKFPSTAPCSAEKMAMAGFYFFGPRNTDFVRCFLCGKELDSWEEEDDPWEEHLKHQTTCYYAQKKKIVTQMTLSETCDLVAAFCVVTSTKKQEQMLQDLEKECFIATKKLKRILKIKD